MARAVSTVLDVAVCLLLVGVAVATLLAGVPTADSSPPDADRAAETLATATATTHLGDRREHRTLAAHLAAAAMANATVEGGPLVKSPYPEAARAAVAETTRDRTYVTARWEPHPGSEVSGRVAVGEHPPPDADVATTVLRVDSAIDASNASAFGALADELAAAYVNWLFPRDRTHAALVDARTASETAGRYESVAGALGTDVDREIAEANVGGANAALADALAAEIEADLRAQYETPTAAAEAVTADEVRVVVRRWDP